MVCLSLSLLDLFITQCATNKVTLTSSPTLYLCRHIITFYPHSCSSMNPRIHSLILKVPTLVQTHLLQRSSGGGGAASSTTTSSSTLADFEGTTQYRSNVSTDMASRIAKGLKIDLGDVLWDAER